MDYDNYPRLIQNIETAGNWQGSRIGATLELMDQEFTFTPGYAPSRKGINYGIGYAEIIQLLGGYFDHAAFKTVAPNSDLQLFTEAMAYGPRIAGQMPGIIQELKDHPDSRRAIVFIGRDSDGPTANLPCTVSIQFLLRRNVLRTVVTMRSWDVIKGLPYDAMMFGALAKVVATLLKTNVGMVTVHAGSAHIYDSDYGKISDVQPLKKYFALTGFRECTSWAQVQKIARAEGPLLEKGVVPTWLMW